MSNYRLKFYINTNTGKEPVLDYIKKLDIGTKAKVDKYIKMLLDRDGVLDEPYARHISGKIRELRVDFARNRHRFFYFAFIKKQIILLHAFQKKAAKTPKREIEIAKNNLQEVENNPQLYE